MDRKIKRLKQIHTPPTPIVNVRWNSRRGLELLGNVKIKSERDIHIFSPTLNHRRMLHCELRDEALLMGRGCHTPCLALDLSDVLCGVYMQYDIIFQDFIIHISYYYVHASSHNLAHSELIQIDPFEEPTPDVSPIIPEPVFETPPISDIPPQPTTTSKTPPVTVIEVTSNVSQPPTTTIQSFPEFISVPHPNVRPIRIRTSTKKDDFVYSCLFASFVDFVHSLHEHESYMEVVCDPLWQGVMAEKLTALH
ncbi:hypothetical protein Tco_0276555 [Tanacetum coccineum]